jgi:hypothetical protein
MAKTSDGSALYGVLLIVFFAMAIPSLIMSAINTHERIVSGPSATTTTTPTEMQFSNPGTAIVVGDFVHVDYAGKLVKGFDLDAWKTLNLTGDVVTLADGGYGQVGNKLYLLGGSLSGFGTTTSNTYEIDLSTNVMTNLSTSGPNPGAWITNPYTAVDSVNQDIYMYGGWDGSGSALSDFSNILSKFHVPTRTWSVITAANNPGQRSGGEMIIYDNRYLYLFGGFSAVGFAYTNTMF